MKTFITRNLGIAKISAALMLGLCGSSDLHAQPLTLPSTPDLPMKKVAEAFNTAMINYGTTTSSMNTNVIFGTAWESGAPIYVHDVGTGVTATCAPHELGDIPDVAIGNAAIAGNFVMAVAYCHHPTSTSSELEVDFYDITGAGTLGLTVTYNSTRIISGIFPYNHNTTHIDIIAEHPAVFTNLPICQKFGVTYEDRSTGMMFVTNGDVSTYFLNPGMIALPQPGQDPDIAAIQREVPFGSGIIDNIALLTYVDAATGDVMYTEFDFTTPGAWALSHMDPATGVSFSVPRIDADDDYATNVIPSTNTVYQIAVQANSGGGSDIHTCNNVLGPGTFFNTTAPLVAPGYTAPYNHFSPIAVKSGPGTYGIFHWTNLVPGSAGSTEATFLDVIVDNTPTSLLPFGYYWVNSSTGTTVHSGQIYTWNGTWSISASSTCNFNFAASSLNLYAWAETNPGFPPTTKYKLSTSAFAFKPGTTNAVTSTMAGADILLSPNPATNQLTISNAFSTTGTTKFRITSVAGAEILSGTVNSNNEKVDISKLTPGNYLVNLSNASELNLNIKFVKE